MSNRSRISRCDDALGVTKSRRIARRNLFNMWLFGANADTGGKVVGLNFRQRRHNFLASLYSKRAACVKAATLRRIDRRRHVTFEDDALARRFNLRVWNGDG